MGRYRPVTGTGSAGSWCRIHETRREKKKVMKKGSVLRGFRERPGNGGTRNVFFLGKAGGGGGGNRAGKYQVNMVFLS